MEWISTKIRFPKEGKQVLAACKNKMRDGYDDILYFLNHLESKEENIRHVQEKEN